jgi:hypothetical protein
LSFWSVPYRAATGCVFQIPFAGGRGDNDVVLLPTDITAFRFANGNHYDVDAIVLAGELRAELAGHTFYTGSVNLFVAAGGVLYGTVRSESDGGPQHDVSRWHITPGGQVCSRWHVWCRREACTTAHREGETFVFSPKDRFETEVYRRVPGNPEGY